MKPDEQFIDDLTKSRDYVSAFAARCKASGASIFIIPTTVRPDAESRKEHSDGGDCVVPILVQHKKRTIPFTDRESFKFATIIVDEVYKVDRITHRPLWYVIESACGESVAVITSRTMAKWQKMRKFDAAQGRECEYYVCPKESALFMSADRVFA